MALSSLGRIFVLFGVVLVLAGLFLMWGAKWPLLGKLPGDFIIRRGPTTIYLPLATSILVSLGISLLLRWLR